MLLTCILNNDARQAGCLITAISSGVVMIREGPRQGNVGVCIGHKICHCVLARSATTRHNYVCGEGPKDQKGRCPASKQVISCPMALKQQVYVFLLSQRQSHVKYRRKLNFAILQRQHVCTARFRLYKRFIWSLW